MDGAFTDARSINALPESFGGFVNCRSHRSVAPGSPNGAGGEGEEDAPLGNPGLRRRVESADPRYLLDVRPIAERRVVPLPNDHPGPRSSAT